MAFLTFPAISLLFGDKGKKKISRFIPEFVFAGIAFVFDS